MGISIQGQAIRTKRFSLCAGIEQIAHLLNVTIMAHRLIALNGWPSSISDNRNFWTGCLMSSVQNCCAPWAWTSRQAHRDGNRERDKPSKRMQTRPHRPINEKDSHV